MVDARSGRNATPVEGPGSPWRPALDAPDHPVARWHGAPVGGDLTLDVWLGPLNAVGARYFRIYLQSEEFGRPPSPLVTGMQNSGPHPGFNWVEVFEYRERLPLDGGGDVIVPEGVERLVFQQLATLVPPGGHLMAEYESPSRSMTARALAAGAPPRATPLGAMLAAVGCGVAFRDWYIAEGGREGPRKLQGFSAANEEHERLRRQETLTALRAFMDGGSAHLEWDLQASARMGAEAAIAELEAQTRVDADIRAPGRRTTLN